MVPVKNPFVHIDGYSCFGCAPHNEAGLKMQFFLDGEIVVSKWEPQLKFAGFHTVLHGGIQSTLMDELASWVVFLVGKTAGTTRQLHAKYHKPVYTDKGQVTLRGSMKSIVKNIMTVHVQLFDQSDVLCSEADVEYFTVPEKIAVKKLAYPGYEAFF